MLSGLEWAMEKKFTLTAVPISSVVDPRLCE
jgi:hypothetical protein